MRWASIGFEVVDMNVRTVGVTKGIPGNLTEVTDQGVVDIGDLIRTLWRGKYMILAGAVLGMVLGGWFGTNKVAPTYTAVATVVKNTESSPMASIGLDFGGSGFNSDFQEIIKETHVLKSRYLMGRVVDELALVQDPEFNGFAEPDVPFEVTTSIKIKRFIKGILNSINPFYVAPDASAFLDPTPEEQREQAISTLIGVVIVESVQDSYVFNISATTLDPRKSALIANTVADAYIEDQVFSNFTRNETTIKWLSGRVIELKSQLEEAESAVADFDSQTRLVSEASVPAVPTASTKEASGTLAPQQRRQLRSRWPDALPVQSYRLGVGDGLLFAPPSSALLAQTGLGQSGLDAAIARRQTYTVQDDGSISIPDIGRIRVVGLTLTQVEQSIFQALIERQKDPSFSIEIADFNSQRVDVSGLVKQPASLPITLKPLYLREALSAVGGTIIENTEDAVVALYRDGETYEMLLSDVYSDAALGRQVLTDGDSISVSTLFSEPRAAAYLKEQISLAQAENARVQLANSRVQLANAARQADRDVLRTQLELGALDRDYVYLVGEVKKQSRFALPFEAKASLADVLFNKDGGGFNLKTANISQVYVLRHSDLSGRINAYHLDAKNIGSIVVAADFYMRPDDFVFIAEQPITRWHRAIQQSVPSLVGTINNITGS